MSDLNLTPDTQAEVDATQAYTSIVDEIAKQGDRFFWLISSAMDKYESASREWQELYSMERLVSVANDLARQARERNTRYCKVPF